MVQAPLTAHASALDATGSPAPPHTYALHGLTCLSCARSVESMLGQTPGVQAVKVNFAANSVDITYRGVPFEQLAERVGQLGYQLVADAAESARVAERHWRGWILRLVATGALALLIVLLEAQLWPMAQGLRSTVVLLLTLVAVGVGGAPFFSGAWAQLRQGETSMDALVALGSAGALALTTAQVLWPQAFPHHAVLHSESAAFILFFILAGRVLEERAKRSSASAVDALRRLEPTHADRLNPDGSTTRVPLGQVVVGDLVRVPSGATVPVDGVLIDAQAELDESLLTGEAEPQLRGARDGVTAGTRNLGADFSLRVTAAGGATLLAQMLARVRRAQESRLPAQRLADRVSAVFVPLALGLAALTLVGWGLIGGDWALGAVYALSVLVVSCPCALGLATPVAVQVAVGRAAQEGLLIRDAEALTAAAQIRAIAFDKTGTLTEGRPRITDAHWQAEADETQRRRWLALARGAAEGSRHPAALALAAWVEAQGITPRTPMQVTETPGLGLEVNSATGERLRIGRPEWFTGLDAAAPAAGSSLVIGLQKGTEWSPLVRFGLADGLRADAAAVLERLRRQGLHLEMLSGDRAAAAQAIAQPLALSVHAELRPEQKAEHLRRLRATYGPVALVGDGANDAEALAGADLSVALAGGANAALDTAQATLVGDRLAPLPRLLALGRHLRRVVAQNLVWAFAYNVVMLPFAAGLLAAFGWPLVLDPRWAGAAMALSSLAVILNSLRLRHLRLEGA